MMRLYQEKKIFDVYSINKRFQKFSRLPPPSTEGRILTNGGFLCEYKSPLQMGNFYFVRRACPVPSLS